MNRLDVLKLVSLCSINYRNFPEQGKEEMLIELWHSMLDDVNYEIAEMAIKKHISLSHFPPTIADLREQIGKITKPYIPTSLEAWGEVTRVIRKYGSYRESEAMKELNGITKKAVEYIGFRDLCISENVMADRAHFLKTYDSLSERESERYALNTNLIEKIEMQKFKMIGGDTSEDN